MADQLRSVEPTGIRGCACDGYGQLEAMLRSRMGEVQMVALDLDGTLLDSQKRVPERNREAIRAAIAAGVEVVPSSGRVFEVIPAELRELPGIRYMVCSSGSSVFDVQAKRSLLEEGMAPAEAARLVRELMDAFDLYVDVACDGKVYGDAGLVARLDEFEMTELQRDFMRGTRIPLAGFPESVAGLPRPVGRVNIWAHDEAERRQILAWVAERPAYQTSNSLETNIEINAAGTSKWKGLIWLCRHLGLNPDRIMAMGDGSNDVDMIDRAWLGVAMRNGGDDAKAAADAVTAYDNDQGGVGRVIDEVLKLRAARA